MSPELLDKIDAMDPCRYTADELLNLLDIGRDSCDGWQVRGASWWLMEQVRTEPPDDAAPAQAWHWLAGYNAAAARFPVPS